MVAINDFCWSAFLTKSAFFLKFAPPGKKTPASLPARQTTSQIIARDSAVGQCLLKNLSCACQNSDAKFSVLARGRVSFRLSALEATFI